MDAVKSFNDELSSIYETKPPVSRAKMTTLTKKAIKGIKFYKHIVQSMEKFIQKCRPEYKVPGLYVIDSVVRQSRHQFGQEKDVFMPRLCKNILNTFKHLYKCPPEEKQRIIRVLNLWQKNSVFPPDIVQQLLVMGGAPTPETSTSQATAFETTSLSATEAAAPPQVAATDGQDQPDASSLTNMLAQLLANPDNPQIQQLTGLLSNSQQAQLQALVHQVKGQQDETEDVKPTIKTEPRSQDQSAVFQPQQHDSQPPFLQSQKTEVSRATHQPPSFNRAVLDYDYSDDDSPKTHEGSHHHQTQGKPGIDMELLAKLPTVDQLQQITSSSGGQMTNGNGVIRQQDEERRRRLEQEQEVFDKQLQQISSEFGEADRSSQDGGSSRSTSRRRRSRSRSHHRHRRRSRSRSRDKGRRSKKSRSRSRDRHRSHRRRSRSSERGREEREREKKGLPPMRDGCVSLCSTTLWIGNLSSKVSQQEIKMEVEAYGPIETINMIPPRGCAFVCMEKRDDASRALHKLRHVRMSGKALKVDWAPGKSVKDEFKEFWSKEHGVNYIPNELVLHQLLSLRGQGFIDIESVPEDKRGELVQSDGAEVQGVAEVKGEPGAEILGALPVGMAPGINPQPSPQGVIAGPAGMPVMMRPAFPFPGMNQFIPQQRMPGFQMPGMANAARPAMAEVSDSANAEITGNRTPTRDEQSDGTQKAALVAASVMSAGQPPMQQQFTMAQPRFQGVGQMGQVPLQIRMMPGMHPHSPQVMSAQRLGMNVMPIRMGVPMHFRHGFPPGVRVPISSPHMMQNPFQQQQMQMQRMGQMVQRLPQGHVRVPGAPVQVRGALFPNHPGKRETAEEELVVEEEEVVEDPAQDNAHPQARREERTLSDPQKQRGQQPPNLDPIKTHMGEGNHPRMAIHPQMGVRPQQMGIRLPQLGPRAPLIGARPQLGVRPPLGERHRVDRPPEMEGRPARVGERPPPGGPGFRRSPGRFGFEGRRSTDGPPDRFPDNDRFSERDTGRDERRRDDLRRRDRSRERSRDHDRRDRGMRERRFERDDRGRDRRGGFGDHGRDRDRMMDRGRFGGWDGFGGGRGRGGFGGGFRGRDEGRFQPQEGNEEEEEYRRKREEVLRQRREKEVDYVAEKIDLSSFGLPVGFGPPVPVPEPGEKDSHDDRRNDKDEDRRRDRDRDRREERDRRDRDRRRDDRFRDDRRDSRRDRRRDSPDRRDGRRRDGDAKEEDKDDFGRDSKRRRVEGDMSEDTKPPVKTEKPAADQVKSELEVETETGSLEVKSDPSSLQVKSEPTSPEVKSEAVQPEVKSEMLWDKAAEGSKPATLEENNSELLNKNSEDEKCKDTHSFREPEESSHEPAAHEPEAIHMNSGDVQDDVGELNYEKQIGELDTREKSACEYGGAHGEPVTHELEFTKTTHEAEEASQHKFTKMLHEQEFEDAPREPEFMQTDGGSHEADPAENPDDRDSEAKGERNHLSDPEQNTQLGFEEGKSPNCSAAKPLHEELGVKTSQEDDLLPSEVDGDAMG